MHMQWFTLPTKQQSTHQVVESLYTHRITTSSILKLSPVHPWVICLRVSGVI